MSVCPSLTTCMPVLPAVGAVKTFHLCPPGPSASGMTSRAGGSAIPGHPPGNALPTKKNSLSSAAVTTSSLSALTTTGSACSCPGGLSLKVEICQVFAHAAFECSVLLVHLG